VPIDIDQLYRRYGPMVLRRCRTLLRNEHKAADAMQDVFVQILRRREMDVDAPSSLLYRTATNVCLNRLRTERRHPEDGDDDLVQRIARLPEAEERSVAASVLNAIFAREPVSSRTIAVLHLLDGLTHDEVAAEVGLSASGVRNRLRRLKSHLSELELEDSP
jgi:RNA polymerase sigma-70 factor (ECF subfamily)